MRHLSYHFCRWFGMALLSCVLLATLVTPTTPSAALTGFDPIQIISISNTGEAGNRDSRISSASSHAFAGIDGRWVVFISEASNLVPGLPDNLERPFIADRWSRKVSLLADSVTRDTTFRTTHVAISSNGRQVVIGLMRGQFDLEFAILLFDRSLNQVTWVVPPRPDVTISGGISSNGRFVIFFSGASDLVPGDTNNEGDVFVYDRVTTQIRLASAASDGTPGNGYSGSGSISATGRYVAFDSWASNLVPNDTNFASDIFWRDMQTGDVRLVSKGLEGATASRASSGTSISDDGRYVAYYSWASNLIVGDNNRLGDLFVTDVVTGETRRITVANSGAEADSYKHYVPTMARTGTHVAFGSWATTLVPIDANGRFADVFVYSWWDRELFLASVAADGTQAIYPSEGPPDISDDGRYVAFSSVATNLIPNDANGTTVDVFVAPANFGSNTLPDGPAATQPEVAPTFEP